MNGEISDRELCCRWFGGKKKVEMEESEPDELGQLEKLEMEYQEEVRRKVRCQLVGILGLKSCVSSRGRSPTISVSIFGSVGPVGTVAPELQASQAGFLPE